MICLRVGVWWGCGLLLLCLVGFGGFVFGACIVRIRKLGLVAWLSVVITVVAGVF